MQKTVKISSQLPKSDDKTRFLFFPWTLCGKTGRQTGRQTDRQRDEERQSAPGLRRVTSKARCDAGISSSTVCQPSSAVLSNTSRYCSLNVMIVRLPLGGGTVHRTRTDVSLTGLISGLDGAATRATAPVPAMNQLRS